MGDEMVRQQMTKNKKTAAETEVISPNYDLQRFLAPNDIDYHDNY
jgi:hypothetical protein